MPPDYRLGLAPHSLRAVGKEQLDALVRLRPNNPIHMHIAEQVAEIEEIETQYGQRPMDWLFDQVEVNDRWCLIHSTHLTEGETQKLAKSGAVAGLCPITEANLGDGIFNGVDFLEAGGTFGIGSDSDIRISLSEELRVFEHSQRYRHKGRSMLAPQNSSNGATLFKGAAKGGARALGRDHGVIAPGKLADFFLRWTATACSGMNLRATNSLIIGFLLATTAQSITFGRLGDIWWCGGSIKIMRPFALTILPV